MTIDDCLSAYLGDLGVRAKKGTLRTAKSHCLKIGASLGSTMADQLNRYMVNNFITELRGRGLETPSINGILRTLRAAIRLAGFGSPVKLLTETRKIPAILDARDVEALMLHAPGPDERLAIALAAYAGLRHAEIAHLDWCDLDAIDRRVLVRAKGGWTPKAHAERVVPMSETLLRAVAEHHATVGKAPLFSSRDFTEGVREAFVAAGLYEPGTKPGLHMLRRTFASRLLATGASIEAVRELGGWADLDTVQRYVAATSDEKRAAVERL